MTLLYLSTEDPLPEAARRVFDALGVEEREERDSDNYPGGNYFRGKVGAFDVRVARQSPADPFYDEFQVLVSIRAPSTLPTPPDEVAQLAAIELLRAKFRVAEKDGRPQQRARWKVYALDAAGRLQTTVLERDLPA
jgi:hypothetical protein